RISRRRCRREFASPLLSAACSATVSDQLGTQSNQGHGSREKRVKTEKAGRPADAELGSRLAAIVESSADAIVGMTLDGGVTSWNDAAAGMYGYAAGEMIGRRASVLLPAGRTGEMAPVLDQIRRGGRVGHYETRRMRKDGTVIDVSVSVSQVRDDSGAIVGAATIARDVTERKWAEA